MPRTTDFTSGDLHLGSARVGKWLDLRLSKPSAGDSRPAPPNMRPARERRFCHVASQARTAPPRRAVACRRHVLPQRCGKSSVLSIPLRRRNRVVAAPVPMVARRSGIMNILYCGTRCWLSPPRSWARSVQGIPDTYNVPITDRKRARTRIAGTSDMTKHPRPRVLGEGARRATPRREPCARDGVTGVS